MNRSVGFTLHKNSYGLLKRVERKINNIFGFSRKRPYAIADAQASKIKPVIRRMLWRAFRRNQTIKYKVSCLSRKRVDLFPVYRNLSYTDTVTNKQLYPLTVAISRGRQEAPRFDNLDNYYRYIAKGYSRGYAICVKGTLRAARRSRTIWLKYGNTTFNNLGVPVEGSTSFLRRKQGSLSFSQWLSFYKLNGSKRNTFLSRIRDMEDKFPTISAGALIKKKRKRVMPAALARLGEAYKDILSRKEFRVFILSGQPRSYEDLFYNDNLAGWTLSALYRNPLTTQWPRKKKFSHKKVNRKAWVRRLNLSRG